MPAPPQQEPGLFTLLKEGTCTGYRGAVGFIIIEQYFRTIGNVSKTF
jgi:hypothetical protein